MDTKKERIKKAIQTTPLIASTASTAAILSAKVKDVTVSNLIE